jgi:hypothetical protein
MGYYESAKGVTIGKARAVNEYRKHGLCADDLVADLGEHDTYNAQSVLGALGY